MMKILKLWSPVLFCMGGIFYTSSIPGTQIPSLFPYQDIIYHAVMFLILAYFFASALKNSYARITALKIIILTLLFGILYGVSDEFHQSFVPNRTPSGFDVFVDSVGTFLGGLIWRLRI